MVRMICPKCSHEQNLSEKCEQCGIVFSEYQQRENRRRGQRRMSIGTVLIASFVLLVLAAIILPNFQLEELADITMKYLDLLPQLIIIAIIIFVFVCIFISMKNNILGRIILISVLLVILAIIIRHEFMPPRYNLHTEATTRLGAIFTSQVTYFGNYGTYASSIENLGWEPVGETRYSYTILEADSTHFIARATGNIDRDRTLDVWEVDHTREMRHVVNDYFD